MTGDLGRLLNPASVAVIGGGAWCLSVLDQLDRMGFPGAVWPVHPTRSELGGRPAFARLEVLPGVPDAAFVGINRDATLAAIAELSAIGAGGAVCFASGFAEVGDGAARNVSLLAAAGAMPILGPNCYGFVNALEGAALWPDQHGLVPVDSGVAILTQSSNMAINLSMQSRGVPISHLVTCGNQAQTRQAEIALALLDDPRVTAIGLHIEGFGDLRLWEALARAARDKGVPLVALTVGRSSEAQAAAISHTASLAGDAAASAALLVRLGIAGATDLSEFLEVLKLFHAVGPLPSRRIATVSCSGGEASLAADLAKDAGLSFPPLNPRQVTALAEALGPRVALANPLDYHTYIWRDTAAMTRAFAAIMDPELALTLLIVDFPRADRCDPGDWDCAIGAAIGAREMTGLPLAMVASLPELMPEAVAMRLLEVGIVPLSGLQTALRATARAVLPATPDLHQNLCLGHAASGEMVPEPVAKAELAASGVPVPRFVTEIGEARQLAAPLVVKGLGHAHKTEAGAVRLGVQARDVPALAKELGPVFVEEMVEGGVAELLVGVTRDTTGAFLLTLGAGGTLTEVMADTRHLLVPASETSVSAALDGLRIAPLLAGHRGRPAADRAAILAAVMAVQAYVLANADRLSEVEINPLICTPDRAVAADALIRRVP